MAREVKKAICHFCHDRCRVLVPTENGRVVGAAEEDPTYPLGGVVPPVSACMRARTIQEFMEHPDRLSFPEKRVGEKGEGKWQRITWEQAFDEIAEKLQKLKGKYGGETLAISQGTLRTHSQFRARFMHLFGSTNYGGAGRICNDPNLMTSTAMFGWVLRLNVVTPHEKPAAQMEGVTKCYLLVGMDPSQAFHRAWRSIREGKALGMKLIVLDPRRTQPAELADIHLQLRPGTDTAVLMSMVNVIIEEGLYDKEFVDKWCHGFDKVVERAKEFPPEKAAEISWVPAEKIREAARMYATSRPAVSFHGMGIEHYPNHIEAIQSRYILAAITGNIDVPGGHYITGPAKDMITESDLDLTEIVTPEQKKKQMAAQRFPLLSFPGYDAMMPHVKRVWGHVPYVVSSLSQGHIPTILRAAITGEPYPIRAMICSANNPMVTGGNTKLWYKALKSLDLYVVCEYWETPSACLADYKLPVASWLERPFFYSFGGMETLLIGGEQAVPETMPGEYDRKTDYDIFRALGIRLGQAEYWPWENLEQTYDYQLSPRGITYKQFMANGGFEAGPPEYRKHEKVGFGTPTGKVEIYSTILEQLGFDPLPHYEETFENPISAPEVAEGYPLYCVTGSRFLPYFHTEQRHLDSIRKRRPYAHVQIHPETAAKYGIKSGDWVWIESPRGRIRQICELFDGTDPRIVYPEHGWWYPELPGEEPWLHGVWESNANVLTDDDPDYCSKIGGGWPLKVALCKIYPCKVY